MEIFLQGLVLGLAYVAPIGIQNIFVINSAAADTFARAIANAFVVAFFDISLAIACFYGIGEIMDIYPWLRQTVLLCGGMLVVCIGVRLLRAGSVPMAGAGSASSASRAMIAACVVTWLNPQALIDGTLMLGAFRSTLERPAWSPFMAGVCAASLIWFPGLASVANLLGNRLGARFFRWVNLICGGVIICYGIRLLFDFAARLLS